MEICLFEFQPGPVFHAMITIRINEFAGIGSIEATVDYEYSKSINPRTELT